MLNRSPETTAITPGEVLRDDVLAGTGITQAALAKAMGVSRFSVNQIINGRRDITAEMALRLAKVLSTTPDFWLNLQREVDLVKARRRLGQRLSNLRVLRTPRSAADRFQRIEDLSD